MASQPVKTTRSCNAKKKKEANKPLTPSSQPLPPQKQPRPPSVNTPSPQRADNHESNMSRQINQTSEPIHPENQQNDTPT